MQTPDRYDDYLRRACELDLLDGPPITLTLSQARAAMSALADDAEKCRQLLLRAIRNTPPPALQPATPNC